MRKIYFLLILVLFAGVSNAQLSGTKTIPGDYASVAAAVTDLNTVGVGAGGVTFDIAAGYTESVTAQILLTATGTSSNPIVFQKSGSGANPKVTRTDAGSLVPTALGAQGDAVITIQGSDYVTFDGLDVAATDATAGVEYGYYLRKAGVTDGCKNVAIKNSAITMVKSTSAYVVGIYSSNNDPSSLVSSATGITVTSTGGRNENVSFTGNTISSVFAGIILRGFNHTTAPNDFQDQNFVVTGNTIQNYAGNTAATSYGVYLIYHTSPTISNNTISNAGGGGVNATSTLYGIFNSTSNAGGNFVANGNTITLSQGATSGAQGIYISPACTSVTVNSNTFSLPVFASTSASYLIYCSNATPTITVNGNSTSGAINKTGAGSFYGYYNFGSPTSGTVTISNNTFSSITLTGASTFYGIYQATVTSQVEKIQNNTISSITGGSSQIYGIYLSYGAAGSEISGNVVSSMSAAAAITGIQVGTTASTSMAVFGNRVNTLSSTSASLVVGLLHSSGTTSNIYKNKIYDLQGSNASSTLNGIQVSGGTLVNLYNNYVGDLRLTTANAAIPLAGINISGGTTVNLYFNTVYINAASTGALFGSSALYASSTPALTLNNNILVNNSTAVGATGFTTAYRRTTTTLTSYGATSNGNDFYAGTPSASNLIFYDGTNSDQTLSAYKTRVATRDGASISENPTFASTTGSNANYLHISTSVPTQLESGGSPISGITDDFDGDIRNASTPDIGADEGTFILLDINPPGVTYTPLSFTCDGSARTLTATITDASGVPTSGTGLPVLYWKINTGSYSASTATYVSGNTYTFSFGAGAVLGDVVSYYIVSQDNAGTPNVGATPSTGAAGFTANPPAAATPPTTPSSYTINGTLNGIYTVGATGTYPTLTAAVADYNAKCLTGPVTFSLIDASYSASETFPIYIYQNGSASATKTLTIKPAPGVTPTISGLAATNFPIVLFGADYVIFDGSNTVGGTTRDLTIKNTNTATNGVATIYVLSQGVGAGATNNTIKNCIIEGPASGTSTSVGFGIYVGGNGTSNGPDNDNLTIQNNIIRKAYYGIQGLGSSAAKLDGLKVIGNQFGSSTSAEYIGKYGMLIGEMDGAQIDGNTIYNIITTNTNPVGMAIFTGSVNSSINGNTVRAIQYTSTGGYGGKGILVSTGSATSNLTFSNNMVSDIRGDGWNSFATDAVAGIYLTGTVGGLKLYNNTVNLGHGTFAGNASGTVSAAFYIPSTASGLDVRNNSFSTNMVNSAASAKTYAIYSEATNAAFTTIDFNNFSATGSQGVLGYLAGDQSTLTALRTAFGQNTNSINATPSFVAADNPHLTNAVGDNLCLNGAATPIAGITTDIDGQTRNATTPDIGADEFNPTLPTFVVNNLTACLGSTADLTAAGVTSGSTAGQTFTYFTDAACTTAVTTPTAVPAGTYYIKATYTSGGCSIAQVQSVTVTYSAPATFTVTGGGGYCVGATSTVTVGLSGSEAGVNYQLQVGGSNTGSPVAGTGSAISFGVQSTVGTYTVIATNASTLCQQTMTGSVSVSTNPLPAVSFVLTQPNNCNSNNGGAALTITGASGPYTFNWTGAGIIQGVQNQSTLRVGPYSVVVTAANGCQTTGNFSLFGPGGCDICPTVGALATTPTTICAGQTSTLNATGLSDLGISYGIDFVASSTALTNPYTGGTVIASVSNASLGNSGTTASATATFNTAGNIYVYAILSPAPFDPACRPFKSTQISVKAIPDVNTVANQTACAGSATPVLNFSGSVSGTVYTWTNSNTAIGLAASGTGNLPSFTATNFSSVPVTATITVTPTNPAGPSNLCAGTPKTFTYTVNPIPTVNTVSNVTACAGATVSVPFSGFVPGTVYNWTNSNTAIGLAATGTGNISFTGTNSGTTPITGAVIVTPRFGGSINSNLISNGGFESGALGAWSLAGANSGSNCDQGFQVYSGNVNNCAYPTCSGGPLDYTQPQGTYGISAAFDGTGPLGREIRQLISIPSALNTASLKFMNQYDVDLQTYCGSCTGARIFEVNLLDAAGTTVLANLYSVTLSPGQKYCQPWIQRNANVASALAPFAGQNAMISYKITIPESFTGPGWIAFDSIALDVTSGCQGTPIAFNVTINPTPSVTPVSNQTICNGSNTTAVTLSGSVTGSTYTWTNSNTSIGLAASGTGNIASFVGVNTGTAPVTSTITITPSYTNGGSTCTGATSTFTITVNPTPTVNAVSNQTICNGATTSAVTLGTTATGGTTTYSWTITAPAGLTGLIASGTGNIPAMTVTNTATTALTATVSITPSYTNGGVTCTGTPRTFTITVNPTPTVNAVSSQVVCNGSNTTAVTFSGAVTGTTYSWTNNTTSIGLAASGSGNIASFAAVNTGTAPVTATITATPSYTNGGTTCAGTPVTFTITVNPTATVNAISNQTVCSGSSTTAVTPATTATVGTTTFSWTISSPAGLTGLTASGTGNIPAMTPVNSGATVLTATVTVTPSFTNGGVTCTGTPRTYTITVNPTPTVNAVSNIAVCNRSSASATFSGAVTGTVYSWTNSNTSIGLAASGTGDIASFTAVNTTQTPVVATITVTPSFTNGGVTCSGTPRTFTITVNPTPIVTATDLFNQRICISDGAVALNGAPVGGTWSGIGVSGFNFIPSATAVGNFVLTYSYTNQYGCTTTDTTTAKVLACDERNRPLSGGGAILYPNPNGGQFNIRVNSTRFQYLQMRIYNDIGQLISTKQWSGLIYGQVLPVDMRHLPAAVYTVRIIYDGGNLYEDKGYQMLIQH